MKTNFVPVIPVLLCLLLPGGCRHVENQMRFTAEGRGAILADIGNGICMESGSGLMWQQGRSRKFRSAEEARQWAENLELAGYDDWRLPTRGEYYRLHAVFKLNRNGNCTMEKKGSYWSELPGGETSAGTWIPDYKCGITFDYERKRSGHVRAVRP
ncbi:MAG TPA: DUF1566 domain-containing protein [Thermodesulfobacteriaceae bacterium]|nr:DUF1566 domain-containing protein [Thermodesulfobacteriaceae bacterium]